MRKGTTIIGLLLLIFSLSGQEIQEEAVANNIEIPVRVFKGNKFIDNLAINDFEVFEDGKLQKIEAVYLIQERKIQREKSEKPFFPETKKRNFILLFEMVRYLPKVGEAVDYFIKDVIMPGDMLSIITPMKIYNFDTGFPTNIPRQVISERLRDIIRIDIVKGNSEFRSLTKELQEIRDMDVHPTMKASKESTYAQTLEKLVKLSCMEERKLTGFAENLKKIEGQKHVFFFFQRRLIPAWGSMTASGFFDDRIAFSERLLDFYYPQTYFDMDKIKGAFADSSISFHFLYITERSRNIFSDMEMNPAEEGNQGVDWYDGTLDFFNTFKEIARATGGITESSVNANSCLKKAAKVSESYYLLYYIPKNYVADGTFKKIEVKVKGKKYRVTHRAGYIAD